MARPQTGQPAEGDQEALLFILQIMVGAAVWVLIASLVGDRLLAETLGSFGMWVAIFPFVRRTWGPHLPVWRYWAAGAMGTAVGAALRILLQ